MNKTQNDFIKQSDACKVPDNANIKDKSPNMSLPSTELKNQPNLLYDKIIRKHILWIADFYKTHSKQHEKTLDFKIELNLKRLVVIVERIQRHHSNRNYTQSFIDIADAYDRCSIIDRSNENYTWDLALQILNNEAMNSTIDKNGETDLYGCSQVIYQKAIHELRKMKYTDDIDSIKNYAKSSIKILYEYLRLADKDNIFNWQRDEAIKLLHIAIIYGKINSKDLNNIEHEIVKNSNPVIFNAIKNEVHDYILLEDDANDIMYMID